MFVSVATSRWRVDGDPVEMTARLDDMCRQLLANGVIEDYRFELGESGGE